MWTTVRSKGATGLSYRGAGAARTTNGGASMGTRWPEHRSVGPASPSASSSARSLDAADDAKAISIAEHMRIGFGERAVSAASRLPLTVRTWPFGSGLTSSRATAAGNGRDPAKPKAMGISGTTGARSEPRVSRGSWSMDRSLTASGSCITVTTHRASARSICTPERLSETLLIEKSDNAGGSRNRSLDGAPCL